MIVDRKSDKFVQLLKHARAAGLQRQVTVGVHSDAGPSRNGVSLVDVAIANEFGVPAERIPERSFIRAWFDERSGVARAKLRDLIAASLQETGSEQRGLQRFATWAEADVKARIIRGIAPANAALTIALKGSTKPLIDRGVLLSAIRARIDGRLPGGA